MTSAARPPRKKKPRLTVMGVAWCTILGFLFLSLLLVLFAYRGAQISIREAEEAASRIEAELPPPVFEAPEGLVGEWASYAAERATSAASEELRERLDEVFAPVHAAVPAYADFHYSVLGEYIELSEAAMRSVSSSMQERLFEGFDPRLEEALSHVAQVYSSTFHAEMQEQAEADRIAFDEKAIMGQATRLAIEDTVARARVGLPADIVAASAGAVGAKAAAAALGKALVKGLTKIAAKSAAKPLGIGSAAAAGAAAGSAGGPPGALLGGLIGATLGWFTMDYAIVKIDELISREDFEADLHRLIDEEKEVLAVQIEEALKGRIGKVQGQTIEEARRNARPDEAGDNQPD